MSDFMNDVKISVIVPFFNAEKYLDSCIRSVLEQTYSNWELILIDDGSTDKSGIIADEYMRRDTRIHVIHQENAGVSSARNRGLDVASGDYISFLDADDEFTPNCLAKLVHTVSIYKADIAAGKYSSRHISAESESQICVWRENEALQKSLMDEPFTYSACAKLFRRTFIGATRFSPEIRINEDSYFVFQLLCKSPCFVGIQDAVYKVNANPNSASRAAFSDKYFDILRVADLKYTLIKEAFPEFMSLADNMQLKARMNLLRLLAVRTGSEYRALEKELLSWVKQNKNSYISAKEDDDKWLFVLTNHLYFAYKSAKHLRA